MRKVNHAKVNSFFVASKCLLKLFVFDMSRIGWGVEHIRLKRNNETVQFDPDLNIFEKDLVNLILSPDLMTSLDYHIFNCFSHKKLLRVLPFSRVCPAVWCPADNDYFLHKVFGQTFAQFCFRLSFVHF